MKVKRTRKDSAPKAHFSFKHNLLPPLAGLLVMGVVFILLNAQWLMAQAKYHFSKPIVPSVSAETIVQSTVKTPDPSAPSDIVIPKINVNAPIVFEPSTAEWKVQLALRTGVDHMGTTANPGQVGNTVIVGHSSGAVWAPGNYKFVFTLLDKLNTGDIIYIDYQGIRYTYKINSEETILPTNLSILNQNIHKPVLTLVTCTPVGTSKYRLVIHADQISPNPAQAAKAATQNQVKAEPKLPY